MEARRAHLLARSGSSEERAIWGWLIDQAQAYPPGTFMPPLRPVTRADKPRRMVAVLPQVERHDDGSVPVLRAIEVADQSGAARLEADAREGEGEHAAGLLFTEAHRRALLVVPFGGREGLHLMLRRWGMAWLAQGYTIQPLGAGNVIKALIVRHEKRSWTLVDHAAMTGLDSLSEGDLLSSFAPGYPASTPRVQAWAAALRQFQRYLTDAFGTAAQVTIGRTALRAAMRHLPENRWLWRTPPLAVAMLRAGGGYRGGYAVASRYQGDAWRADMNKAYAWALSEQLPHRMALVRPQGPLWTRDGLYLCEVKGRGQLPVYLGVWKGGARGFEREYHEGGDVWAILPLVEAHGLNRLGYQVRPVMGYEYTGTFDLAPFVAQLQGILDAHPRGSPPAHLAKVLGVNVYGKLAEGTRRVDLMYSADRPGDAWHPYTDLEGNELEALWERRAQVYRPHQRIDVAAQVTARVRSRLYQGLADALDEGVRVVHADTDGFLATGPLSGLLRADPRRIGAWRADEDPLPTFVWGRKAYAYGDDVRVAGGWGINATDARLLAQGGTLAVEQSRMAVPWKGTAIFEPLTRTMRATV